MYRRNSARNEKCAKASRCAATLLREAFMNYLQYHEKTSHGKFNFPIQLYRVSSSHPRYEMPFHWHVECELILVRYGSFALNMDGRRTTLHAGESAFVHGGCLHGGSPSSCVYECLVFDMEKILHDTIIGREKYMQILNGSLNVKAPFSPGGQAGKLVASIMSVMERQKTGYEFITVGLLWQFFGVVIQQNLCVPQADGEKTLGWQALRMKKVLRRIRIDYGQPLSLAELASEAAMVPQYFCRAFRKVTGKTPIEYLNYYRIECAAEQLISTHKQVTEIAFQCGFNDVSYFIKLFTRYKGMTASAYRKAHAAGAAAFAPAG